MKVRSLFPGVVLNSFFCATVLTGLWVSKDSATNPEPLFLPGQREVVSVVLQGFAILLEVEVGVAQLAVDGAKRLQFFRAHLDGGLKERCPAFKVPGFAQSLPFQRQLQAGGLHPGGDKSDTSESLQPHAWKRGKNTKLKESVICLVSIYQQPVFQPLVQRASCHGDDRVTGVTMCKLKAALALH